MPFPNRDLFTVRRVDPVRWSVVVPLVYHGRTQSFIVPAGYVTDFASVPWFVQWLVPRTGVWTLAAVLHDYLITNAIGDGRITSRDTDGMFRRVMREEGVDFCRRWIMWAGVRLAAPLNKGRRPSGLLADAPALVAVCVPVLAVVALAVAGLVAL